MRGRRAAKGPPHQTGRIQRCLKASADGRHGFDCHLDVYSWQWSQALPASIEAWRRQYGVQPLPKSLPVLVALALVLGLGTVATAFIWPQAFKAAWNWGGSLLSRRDARPAQPSNAQPPPEVGV